MKPLHPSSFHILASALCTDILYSSRPTDWIWLRIFSLSRGETTVLETAPATPPAQNAAVTGSANSFLNLVDPFTDLGLMGPCTATGDGTDYDEVLANISFLSHSKVYLGHLCFYVVAMPDWLSSVSCCTSSSFPPHLGFSSYLL